MNERSRRARSILESQVKGICQLETLIEREEFGHAIDWIVACRGRVLITGVGKSGIVASKFSATLRSTGTPSVYLHPLDAAHGDLGLVGPDDLAIFISKSGESRELLELVPTFKQLGVPILSIVGHAPNSLSGVADLVLDVGSIEEAGPIEAVPTTSTTVFQVLGDTLTLLVLWEKGITQENFAFVHPGGSLGRLVNLRVRDVMHSGPRLPIAREDCSLREALVEMIDKRLGLTTVVDTSGRLTGILTDGDIRRILHEYGNIEDLKVLQVMSKGPKTIDRGELLASAVHKMETNHGGPITSLVIVDQEGKPSGVIHLHDCLRQGMGAGPKLA